MRPDPAPRQLRPLSCAQHTTLAEQRRAASKTVHKHRSSSAGKSKLKDGPSQAQHEMGADRQRPASAASQPSAKLPHDQEHQHPTKGSILVDQHYGAQDLLGPKDSQQELRPPIGTTAEQGVPGKKAWDKDKHGSPDGPSSGMQFWLQMRQAAGSKANAASINKPQIGLKGLTSAGATADAQQTLHDPALSLPGAFKVSAANLPSKGFASPPSAKRQQARQGLQRDPGADLTTNSARQSRQGPSTRVDNARQDSLLVNSLACDDSDGSSEQIFMLDDEEEHRAPSHVQVRTPPIQTATRSGK